MKKYRKLLIILSILLVPTIAFIGLRTRGQINSQSSYQTVEAQRGSLLATIGATGTVRSNQSANLPWQTSGTVGDVQVSLGEKVVKGFTLATLLPNSIPPNVILAQADLVNAQRALETAKLSVTIQSQAQLELANAQKIFDDARITRLNLRNGINLLNAVDYAEAQYIIANNAENDAQEAYDNFSDLADDNTNKAQAFSTLYNARENTKAKLRLLNWYKGQASDNDVSIADGNVALAEAQLQDAKREWNRLKDGPDPDDIASAQARVTASQATLNSASILAPFSGTVTEVKVMPGDQVSPGITAFRIDDLTRLLVDVQVSEVDINGIKIGQPVTNSFDAILDEIYHGKVLSVAQVGNTIQGTVIFTVTVELTDLDDRVKPEMTSAVTIVVNQLDNVLLVPNRAVRLVNNQRVVYILVNGVAKEVKISLGATSGIESEVLSGDLKVGDLIILNPSLNFGPGEGDGNGGGMRGMFGG